MTHKVKVKWGRETFENVELNTLEEPLVFKAQLYALTGVLPQRQKVMIRGATIKDETWGGAIVTDNCTVLMMGSKEEDVPVEPSVKPKFIEDMNAVELATATNIPAGLANLGNTCYMNATVQCLKTVPELRDSLRTFKGGVGMSSGFVSSQSVTAAMRDLYDLMDKGMSVPLMLLQVLQMVFPRFADKNENGTFAQQDANECWTEIVRMLQQRLPAINVEGSATNKENFIDQFFGGVVEVKWECTETKDEPLITSNETFLQLSCFISQEVKYMHSGLKSKLMETITKHSSVLNRDAVFTKTSKISRLPAYLTIQFVRFFYKEKESINAKILKEIKFPMEYDAFDLCTPELQSKLTAMRDKFKEQEDLAVQESIDKKELSKGTDVSKNKDENDYETVPFSFDTDYGTNNSGYYTLQAVLTHRGRSSSSGHYVSWIKYNDNWMKCDDDVVTQVHEEEILKLCGGGDWHCAYVLLYGPKILKVKKKSAPSTAAK